MAIPTRLRGYSHQARLIGIRRENAILYNSQMDTLPGGMRMRDLLGIVRRLVATKKDGDHWDFKESEHACAGDLIKDIMCLANSPRHTGDRYIIYGVDDTGVVKGVPRAPERKQADIVNTLSRAGFAGGVYPDIYRHQVNLEGHRVDVLVIKDRPEKPYYLQKSYNKHGVRLSAGTVYARVRDSNTPSDQVASSHDIEKMWRERFGLEQTPLARVQNYLVDPTAWTKTADYVWYHSQFPEFTVSPTSEEMYLVRADENWVRAALNPTAFVRPLQICFHQTVLKEIPCILYDEARAITPAPRPQTLNHRSDVRFFSLCGETLEFALLQLLTEQCGGKLLQDGLSGVRLPNMTVVLFSSREEEEAFVVELEQNPVVVEDRHNCLVHSDDDPEISEDDKRIIAFSNAVIERLKQWRLSS